MPIASMPFLMMPFVRTLALFSGKRSNSFRNDWHFISRALKRLTRLLYFPTSSVIRVLSARFAAACFSAACFFCCCYVQACSWSAKDGPAGIAGNGSAVTGGL